MRRARSRGVIACPQAAGEAYQRAFNIVKQASPCARGRVLSRNEHVVGAAEAMQRKQLARGLAQAPARPVAHGGVANLAGGGEAHGAGPFWWNPDARLDDDRAPTFRWAVCGAEKLAALAQPVWRPAG
jgi:hypothetical protein